MIFEALALRMPTASLCHGDGPVVRDGTPRGLDTGGPRGVRRAPAVYQKTGLRTRRDGMEESGTSLRSAPRPTAIPADRRSEQEESQRHGGGLGDRRRGLPL